MSIADSKSDAGAFAIWVTGLPASGKSTLVRELRALLQNQGCPAAVLESDVLRQILTPQPKYDEAEREAFYGQMAKIGALLVEQGVAVIFDATANRRAYRNYARSQVRRFVEVYVDCPLEVCIARDPKGIYRRGSESGSQLVPGLQVPYEPPEKPEVLVHCEEESKRAAQRVMWVLKAKHYLRSSEEAA